jgi:hypothetical protein
MRYMLLMQGTQADLRALGALPAEDRRAHLAFLKEVDSQLHASGELVSAHALAGPDTARLVRAQGGVAQAITRAAFPDARAFLAAYWVIDCGAARATAVAAQLSAAPGRGGVALELPIEVRPLMRAPGEEM